MSSDSDSKQTIQQVRQAERFMAAVVDSSDDAIITKDLNGVITSWNQGAERLFGYTAQEAIGRPITMLIPADREGEEPRILARLRKGERIDHYETIRRRRDGTLLDIFADGVTCPRRERENYWRLENRARHH